MTQVRKEIQSTSIPKLKAEGYGVSILGSAWIKTKMQQANPVHAQWRQGCGDEIRGVESKVGIAETPFPGVLQKRAHEWLMSVGSWVGGADWLWCWKTTKCIISMTIQVLGFQVTNIIFGQFLVFDAVQFFVVIFIYNSKILLSPTYGTNYQWI